MSDKPEQSSCTMTFDTISTSRQGGVEMIDWGEKLCRDADEGFPYRHLSEGLMRIVREPVGYQMTSEDAVTQKTAAEVLEDLQRENAKLRELCADIFKHLDNLPPGPWETWTSCSFRRITGPDGRDGSVLHALNQISDGHPDLSWTERECEAICAIVNGLRALREDGKEGQQ